MAAALALLCTAALLSPKAARAQRGGTSGDTVGARSLPPRRQRPDSVQPRIGRDAPLPTLDIGAQYAFTREELFATGALTLGDLLDRLPGYTTYRAGWLPSPQTTAIGGDFTRVRVFIDGLEFDDLTDRNGAAPDLHQIPIWMLQTLSLRRDATELRVDLRTWEYTMTTPYTRADILTGDYNTNLYRAFYGKRYYNGAGLQVAAQQYGITDVRTGGSGDQLSVLLRYGVARRGWSVDASAVRFNGSRNATGRYGEGMLLPGFRSANTIGYLRAAVGDERGGPYLQLVASTEGMREYSPQYNAASAARYGFVADTADTLASAAQYVATAGINSGGLRARVTERYRRRLGHGFNSPEAELDFIQPMLSVTGHAERDEYAGATRLSAGARVTPLAFVSLAAFVDQRSSFGTSVPGFLALPTTRSARLEAGVRPFPRGPWLIGGAIVRDTALLLPPRVFDTAFVAQAVGRETGSLVELRGPVGNSLSVDGWLAQWPTHGPYTPKYQANARASFYTEWLSRFPNHNFSFLLQPSIDYRSQVNFPSAAGDRFATVNRTVGVLVELRILRGVISYQRRNATALLYDQVPGFLMPRPINVYGVRWYFYD